MRDRATRSDDSAARESQSIEVPGFVRRAYRTSARWMERMEERCKTYRWWRACGGDAESKDWGVSILIITRRRGGGRRGLEVTNRSINVHHAAYSIHQRFFTRTSLIMEATSVHSLIVSSTNGVSSPNGVSPQLYHLSVSRFARLSSRTSGEEGSMWSRGSALSISLAQSR